MKSFCILEQGRYINEPITLKNKNLFTTEFSDFYRLNWCRDDDPNAFLTQKNIVWSEGRSLLYEKVPKNYDYYIFIDDDVTFSSHTLKEDNIAVKIKDLLNEYKPLAGTFFNSKSWGFSHTISRETYLSKKAFPIYGYDFAVHIFSKSFADVMLPPPFHGVHNSMWYCQWVCHKLFPGKQVCFTDIQYKNNRREFHEDYKKILQLYPSEEIVYEFSKNLKNESTDFKFDKTKVVNKNTEIFNSEVDRKEVIFDLKDLRKLYDIDNYDFKRRKSLADSSYKIRLLGRRLRNPKYSLQKIKEKIEQLRSQRLRKN